MTPDQAIEAAQAETFADTFRALARGTLNDEATMALRTVTAAVSDLGKPGSVTITIKVDRTGSTGRTVVLLGEVKTKAPTPDPEATIRFVGGAGSLHLDDPYSRRLPAIPFVDTDGVAKVVDPISEEVLTLPEAPAPVAETPSPTPIDEDDQA